MGSLLSLFQGTPPISALLEDIDKKLKSITEFQEATLEREILILWWHLAFSIFIFVSTLLVFLSSTYLQEFKLYYFIGLGTFFVLSYLSRKGFKWHYNRLIVKSSTRSVQLLQNRQKILDNVKDTMTYREAKDILDKFGRIPHTPRIIASAYTPPEAKSKVFQRIEAPAEPQFRKNHHSTADSCNSSQHSAASPSAARPASPSARDREEIPIKRTPPPSQQQQQTPSKPLSPSRPTVYSRDINSGTSWPKQSHVTRPTVASVDERTVINYQKDLAPMSHLSELDNSAALKREVQYFSGKLEKISTVRNGQETLHSARLTTTSLTARQAVNLSQGFSTIEVNFATQKVVYPNTSESRSLGMDTSSSRFDNNLMISSPNSGSSNSRNRRYRQSKKKSEQQLKSPYNGTITIAGKEHPFIYE